MSRQLPLLRMSGEAARACNGCRACCTVLGVAELAKKPGARCVNLTARGCGIYATRPDSCRQFACLWAQGLVDKPLRPDKTDCVVSVNAGGNILVVYELVAGAHKRGAFGVWLRARIDARVPIIIVPPDSEHRRGYNLSDLDKVRVLYQGKEL